MSAESLQQVIGLVDQLARSELIEVLHSVSARLSRPAGGRRSILELQGLGKDAWSDVDADELVDRERSSWNG